MGDIMLADTSRWRKNVRREGSHRLGPLSWRGLDPI